MEIPITIKNHDTTFKQNVDVPTDMIIDDLLAAAQEQANMLSLSCYLNRDKTNTKLIGNETIESAGIQPGESLTLTPLPQGG